MGNIQVVALSFTSLKLTWSSPAVLSRCVRRYVAEFFHGTESTVYSTVDSTTLLTVSGLTRGVHYSIAITARDGEGRVGTETARVPYTLDGTNTLNTLSMYCGSSVNFCLSMHSSTSSGELHDKSSELKWDTSCGAPSVDGMTNIHTAYHTVN